MNRKEKNNHMVTIIDAEKVLDKIQHSFMMKTLSNLGIERNNLIKNIYKKKPNS